MRSNLVEVGAGDVDPSHDQVGADVTLVPGQTNLSNLTNRFLYYSQNTQNNCISFKGFNATVLHCV